MTGVVTSHSHGCYISAARANIVITKLRGGFLIQTVKFETLDTMGKGGLFIKIAK